MPPTSSIRRTNAQTMTVHGPHSHHSPITSAHNDAQVHRRTTASGRAIRANATRPANYYARPFGSLSAAIDADGDVPHSAVSPGFFPALQFFTDAVTALPKEVMKQFTLVKEVEAKVYGPNEKLGELIDAIMEHPVPARKPDKIANSAVTAVQGLLTLTANNSTSGSANASVINGIDGRHSAQPSLNGSLDGEPPVELEDDRHRRHQYQELRMLTHSLLANLDEKNVVLSEANRVLAQQHTRLDSVWPHVESEISEEAQYGSMTHWAYSDNRQKTKAVAAGAQNRRDVAATNNLAAAANAFHESEIAQARRDAGREAAREKTKGKRTEHVDSDFDEKPRKAPKLGKNKLAALAGSSGFGITGNGEPATGRKGKKAAEKESSGTGMARTVSSQGKVVKARETPRSTPADEFAAKKPPKAKPGPPKRKLVGSAQNSPMLASSPLASSFNPNSIIEPPPNARPQSARLRQNSGITSLRHEGLQDEEANERPATATAKINGNSEKFNGRRKVNETTEEHEEYATNGHTERDLNAASEKLAREENGILESKAERKAPGSRSESNSRKGSGRGSKVGTPRQESFHSGDAPGTGRARTTRSRPNAREGSSSDEVHTASATGHKHKRNMSNSHLVKQLAPFNKSPNLDRHKDQDDGDDDLDSLTDDDLERAADGEDKEPEMDNRRSSTRRPLSRRNTVNTLRSSPLPMSRESSPPLSPPPPPTARSSGRTNAAAAREAAAREAEAAAAAEAEAEGEEEEDDSEHDPDDPNEPRYCYCNRGSYGEMVACDNENCTREWFHLGCTELREAPSEDEKWYCKDCKPLFSLKMGRKGKAGRGARGG